MWIYLVWSIQYYKYWHLFPPSIDWPEYMFVDRSYAIWAADSLITRIEQSPVNPFMAIDDFISEMREYVIDAESETSKRVFTIALDTAEAIKIFLEGEGYDFKDPYGLMECD